MFGPIISQFFVSLEDIPSEGLVTLDIATGKVRRAQSGEYAIGTAREDIPAGRIVGLTNDRSLRSGGVMAERPKPPGLPERITIGPLVFRVTDDQQEHHAGVVEDLSDTWGRIRCGKGLIILDPNQSDAHKRLALLHEVMHGCWHIGDRGHKNDEKAIRSLVAPLLDVLRRNPELVAYLLAEDTFNATI